MEFCWITINVRNMEESLHFYHEIIGLKIAERFKIGDETEIAMLGEVGGTKVELICNKDHIVQSTGLSIGFEVDSLEKAMELMRENNISIQRGPISPNPSVSFFFINDPNGLEVQIVQHSH
ncbi:VOC family protein [Lachnoclostridium phytofermentans]|uniref:Glyoxalase/bleomycin resistance protein/dioxygenase n=1 Tax=Lachnoclostridium phytofermentans (strain ATCC 700394 / DSM 18823 / ISDg) TaxID=357809 RepID=A9KJ70_LACP7|nr:VOC family protein [Lachnoclostridium phytofermentans]ABX42482.1 Glyoxalase/bleomycin resistance protein/dioxygenase [Lachnoclostridium phytofermentans ISDg]